MIIVIYGIIKRLLRPSTPIRDISLPSHPPVSRFRCRNCGSTYLKYDTVKAGNPHGNDGRPYYVCVNPRCPSLTEPDARQHIRGWVTWDDDLGMASTNPLCHCQRNARLDTAGAGLNIPGRRFWTCSTGACGYTSWRLDGSQGWGDF